MSKNRIGLNGILHPGKSMVSRYTRSTFGNICCCVLIVAAGLFSMLPLIYAVVTSFKPIDELLIFPPTFFVRRPTPENYVALPTLLSSLSVPLSRYVFNSLFITVVTSVFGDGGFLPLQRNLQRPQRDLSDHPVRPDV